MPLLMPGTDITDIPDTTVDTDTDTGAAKSVKLNPLPLLRPTLRLKLNPGTMAVGVDIMAIPIIEDITDGEDIVVTGGKL